MTVKELRNRLFAFADDTEVEIVSEITTVDSILTGRTRNVVAVMQTNDMILIDTEYGKDVGTVANERALLICGNAGRGRADEA